MTRAELREKVARALCDAEIGPGGWDAMSRHRGGGSMDRWRRFADAALAAIRDAAGGDPSPLHFAAFKMRRAAAEQRAKSFLGNADDLDRAALLLRALAEDTADG